jgi:DNA-binding transcriptional regulator LsrR (DeoR family)
VPDANHYADSLGLGALLTETELVALAEAFGGRRLYVPTQVSDDHRIAQAIGRHAAERMVQHLARNYIRIPLMRERRALHYRRQGTSNGEIASKLGMTEAGVDAMFKRIRQ